MKEKPLIQYGIFFLEFVGICLIIRWIFPIFLPFLLGLGLALLSEREVAFLNERVKVPRAAASFFGVSISILLLGGIVWLAAALGYRELSGLAGNLPEFSEKLSGQIDTLRSWLLAQTARLPAGLDLRANRAVSEFFAGGSALMDRVISGLVRFAGALLGGIPGGALLTATAVISGYMISGQLPQLRRKLSAGKLWKEKLAPAAKNLHNTLGAWLKAQVKLSGITFAMVLTGLVILGVRYAPVWAFCIALVDAVPMLGTGTVLVPWAVWSLLGGNTVKALGLAGIYVAAMVTRSALEPRLVGRHLGLNPLVTLMALYAGYRLWGVAGMVLSPILAVTAAQLVRLQNGDGKMGPFLL